VPTSTRTNEHMEEGEPGKQPPKYTAKEGATREHELEKVTDKEGKAT